MILVSFDHFAPGTSPRYLLGKGGYFFGSVGLFVCLSVCLSVCGQHYSKSYERIRMKVYGGGPG